MEEKTVTAESLTRRIELFMEDEDWDKGIKYCNRVLDIEPENARAYLLLVLCKNRVSSLEKLSDLKIDVENDSDYKRAYRFGDAEQKKTLDSYLALLKNSGVDDEYKLIHGNSDDSNVSINSNESVYSQKHVEEKLIIKKAKTFGKNKATGNISKVAKIFAATVIAVAIALFVANEIGKASLKKTIEREWLYSNGNVIQVLDFSDGKVEYRVETGLAWLDTTLGTWEYKVAGRNTLEIKQYSDKYKTYKVKFNDDKTMMTVTPAITSVDDSEEWFYYSKY